MNNHSRRSRPPRRRGRATLALAFGLAHAMIGSPAYCAHPDRAARLRSERLGLEVGLPGLELTVLTGEAPGSSLSQASPDLRSEKVIIRNRTDSSLELEYPGKGLRVSISLDGTDIAIRLSASEAQSLRWPVTPLEEAAALLWPFKDGRYIPLTEKAWIEDISEAGAHDLGSGLPAWGIAYKDNTLALATIDPYRAALAIENRTVLLTQDFLCRRGEEVRRLSLRAAAPNDLLSPASLYRKIANAAGSLEPLKERLGSEERRALLGAYHFYLWGDDAVSVRDLLPAKTSELAALVEAGAGVHAAARAAMDEEALESAALLARDPYAGRYAKACLARGLSAALRALGPGRFEEAYGRFLVPLVRRGQGISPATVTRLKALGIRKARLTLPNFSAEGQRGAPSRAAIACSAAASEAGYLFGAYDSFHSIHPESLAPDEGWETARFDEALLYDTGAVMSEDGSYRKGFQGVGRLLSPIAARPAVERRVEKRLRILPMSFYFVDCDAAAEIGEDYNPLHPSTAEEDAAARRERLRWLADRHGLVVGTEGGDASVVGSAHLSEGLFGPAFYWESPAYRKGGDRYWGAFWPPEEPAVQFKPVPLLADSERRYLDPRFRLPLFQAAFHDIVIMVNHWSADPYKFEGMEKRQALYRALYLSPALFNLSRERLDDRGKDIAREYAALAPILEAFGDAALEGFSWLDEARLVHEARYAGGLRVIANFGASPFSVGGSLVSPGSARITLPEGRPVIFTP